MILPNPTPEERLKFDEARHAYLLDGKPVPSVTNIISRISEDLMLSTPFIKKTMIGTQVHKICEKINNDEKVIIEALGEDIRGYVMGYKSFLDQREWLPLVSEMRVYSPRYRFAGTLDIIAKDEHGQLAVMDIKTSAIVSPTTALQLSAYKHCVEELGLFDGRKIKHRICVWLTGGGEFDLIHYKEPDDFNVFLCHLSVHNWRKKHNLD